MMKSSFGLKGSSTVSCSIRQGLVRNGMERKFRYGIWKMPEWNGRFPGWNGKQSSILPYQFHTKLRALYLQKNIYGYRVVINNKY